MNKRTSKIIFPLALISLILSFQSRNNICFAQEDNKVQLNYSVKLDTNVINIGDQINLDISFQQPKDLKIDFPVLTDSISSGIEIIHEQEMDTSVLDNNFIEVLKRYKISSFDAGLHKIPPFKFKIHNKNYLQEINSDTLFMGVRTMEIDSTKGPADIVMPLETPLSFEEIYPILTKILLGLIIIAVIIFGIFIYTKKKNNENLFKKEEIEEEAHIVALRSLEEIKNDNLCNKGQIKEYHSRLTDTIKLYLYKRFELASLESTTDEIIELLRGNKEINKKQINELKFIFETADLAKFAKFIPLNDDNHKSYTLSYKFIEETIKKETIDKTIVNNEKNIEETK